MHRNLNNFHKVTIKVRVQNGYTLRIVSNIQKEKKTSADIATKMLRNFDTSDMNFAQDTSFVTANIRS